MIDVGAYVKNTAQVDGRGPEPARSAADGTFTVRHGVRVSGRPTPSPLGGANSQLADRERRDRAKAR